MNDQAMAVIKAFEVLIDAHKGNKRIAEGTRDQMMSFADSWDLVLCDCGRWVEYATCERNDEGDLECPKCSGGYL